MDDVSDYNEMAHTINELTDAELDALIKEDKCPFRPELMPKGISIGMFHCELCGEMVIAGIKHPRQSLLKET